MLPAGVQPIVVRALRKVFAGVDGGSANRDVVGLFITELSPPPTATSRALPALSHKGGYRESALYRGCFTTGSVS